MLYDLIFSILFSLVLLASAGFIVYKRGRAESWEQGIAVFAAMILKLIRSLLNWLMKCFRSLPELVEKVLQWWQRNDPAYFVINEALALAPNEVTALIKGLAVRPYITPARKRVGVDNGVWCLEIRALGLQERYAAMSPLEIRELVGNVFTEITMEERGEVPSFYIPIATAHRLLLYIPLSRYGYDFLQRKIRDFEKTRDKVQAENKTEVQPLTEEVPDFSESIDTKCDSDT